MVRNRLNKATILLLASRCPTRQSRGTAQSAQPLTFTLGTYAEMF